MYAYVAFEVKDLVYRQIRRDLGVTAGILIPHIPSIPVQPEEVDAFCKSYAGSSGVRLTVINSEGIVLGDSEYAVSMMNNHADRPEILAALRGQEGFISRYSVTLGLDLAYLALPVVESGKLTGVFRISRPVDDIQIFVHALNYQIVMLLIIIILGSGIYGYFLSSRMRRVFFDMEAALKKIDSGEYKIMLDIPFPLEARAVADMMNRMAHRLDYSIAELTARNTQLEAILTNMVEPVVLLGRNLQIRHLNRAAVQMLEIDPAEAIGKGLLDTFRNSSLYEFAEKVQQGDEVLEISISLTKNQKSIYLQVHGTLIHSVFMDGDTSFNQDQQHSGDSVLLVFNNITRIKNLEKMRQDFVANVSHELKTPITSINGFVETLLGGAMDNHDEAVRFLTIVDKQTRRLNSIIDDLLSLSKLENLEHQQLKFDSCNINGIISAAIKICGTKAEAKNIKLIRKCENSTRAEVIPLLIEQALVNIIDNAINYSDDNSEVIVACTESEEAVLMSVQDYGAGIPGKDLSRIFERFYRVDKARSREVGGTGLGLAIAKHIILAHNGTIRVASELGEGSSFYINLPRQQN